MVVATEEAVEINGMVTRIVVTVETGLTEDFER